MGGVIGVLAVATQAVAVPTIPDWTGDKANPVGLGLLTVALSVFAPGSAISLRPADASPSAGRRAVVTVGLLVPGVLCLTTVGRLWYLPGALLVAASALTVAAGGVRELETVAQMSWKRVLLTLLGAFELLKAVTSRPRTPVSRSAAGRRSRPVPGGDPRSLV